MTAKVGTFVLRSTVGTQVISGLGFAPTFVLFTSGAMTNQQINEQGSLDNTKGFVGSAALDGDDVITQGSDAYWSESNLDVSKVRHRLDGVNCISFIQEAVEVLADLDSFDAGGFTLDVTQNTNAASPDIYFIAFEGVLGSVQHEGDGGAGVGDPVGSTGYPYSPLALILLGTVNADNWELVESALHLTRGVTDGTVQGTAAANEVDAADTPDAHHGVAYDRILDELTGDARTWGVELTGLVVDGWEGEVVAAANCTTTTTTTSTTTTTTTSITTTTTTTTTSTTTTSTTTTVEPCAWLGINSGDLDSFCGEEGGTELADALDGTDLWGHEEDETHEFVLDLGQTYAVDKVRGRSNSEEDPTDVDIYVSDDDQNWGTAVAEGITTWQDTSAWQEVVCASKNGRYIRVVVNATEDTEHSHLLWGAETPFAIFDVCARTLS